MNLWYSTETVTSWLLRYVSNEWLRKDMRTEKSLLKWKVGPLLIWSSNPLTAKYLHGGHFTLGGPPLSLLPRLKLFMTHKTLQWLHPCQHFSISTLFYCFNKDIFSFNIVRKSKKKSHFKTKRAMLIQPNLTKPMQPKGLKLPRLQFKWYLFFKHCVWAFSCSYQRWKKKNGNCDKKQMRKHF